MLHLKQSTVSPDSQIRIPGSKSESNRALILSAIYDNIAVDNLSDADDTIVLQQALATRQSTVNIGHAGTAMRFLTAYFAMCPGVSVILTGSNRMQQRPIGLLVDALRQMGADIEYDRADGFPPLRINGNRLTGGALEIRGDISSQFISAIMLSAPTCTSGLKLSLIGNITSRPYIDMTARLMTRAGIDVHASRDTIVIPYVPKLTAAAEISVEPDWSAASYYYSIIALAEPGATLELYGFRADSLQGDSKLADIYTQFGVMTTFTEKGILLTKAKTNPVYCKLDLADTPDLAQTIAVTCLGLNIGCHLTGLHTLRIKETDRLSALQNEISKFGAEVSVSIDFICVKPSVSFPEEVVVETYDDHRMAMAFAPLVMITDLWIRNPEVVSKSYPQFWNDLRSIGIELLGSES